MNILSPLFKGFTYGLAAVALVFMLITAAKAEPSELCQGYHSDSVEIGDGLSESMMALLDYGFTDMVSEIDPNNTGLMMVKFGMTNAANRNIGELMMVLYDQSEKVVGAVYMITGTSSLLSTVSKYHQNIINSGCFEYGIPATSGGGGNSVTASIYLSPLYSKELTLATTRVGIDILIVITALNDRFAFMQGVAMATFGQYLEALGESRNAPKAPQES